MTSRVRLFTALAAAVTASSLTPRLAKADDTAFVYVDLNPSQGANSIIALSSTPDGQLSVVAGSPYATGGLGLTLAAGAEYAHRIQAAQKKNLLFAANDGSGTVSVFKVDPIFGTLTGVSGSPFRVGSGAAFSGISLATSKDSRFLYASGSSLVSYSVDDNGKLTEIGSRWSFAQRVAGIAVSDDNSRVFLSTPGSITILHTGEAGLTADTPIFLSLGSTATDLRANGAGSLFWVGTQNGGVTAYSYDSTTASLVPGAPFFTSVTGLSGLALASDATSLFAFSPTAPRLAGMHVNADGSLVLRGSPIAPPLAPLGGALTPDAHRLLLVDGFGQLDLWAASDGALTHNREYPVSIDAIPGAPSVTTFPKTNPVPASPAWMLALLATIMLGVGVLTAPQHSPTVGPRLGASPRRQRIFHDAFLVCGLAFVALARRLRIF